eukprot:TRINITY_DN84_c0_g1_i1.p1 TRINITY_DN84_c0_g1~~TRINITY_DN84_c0_g1_i1.p1  ORF type:complete len:260 (+),score=121.20 TRINITY_DN84_c0_g1_i1:311-1090(+)
MAPPTNISTPHTIHNRDKTLALFDIDGTIAEMGQPVSADMKKFIAELRTKVSVAIVGGSMMLRVIDKLGPDVLDQFDYVFAENGLVAYKDGNHLASNEIAKALPNDKMNELINFCLGYLAQLDLPVKRGTFIDFRTGLINVSPAGRFLSKQDRATWVAFDEAHRVREKMVRAVKEKTKGWGLEIVIGGQMGFDIFPQGWDKSFCRKYLTQFEEIHFFGDNFKEGGNDYPLYSQKDIHGYGISHGPSQTRKIAEQIFFKN